MEDKKISISVLRIFATIAVVWLHTCSTLTDNRNLFDLTEMQNSFFGAAYSIMNWAVPVFLMITGVLMLGRQTDYKSCFGKYIRRGILALFMFGIPFAVLKLVMETKCLSPETILQSFLAVICGDSFAHLWYLYVLIGIYLVLPVLQKAVQNIDNKQLKCLIIILFVTDFVVPTISSISGMHIAFLTPFSWPLFYLLVGYYLNVVISKSGGICKILGLVLISGFIVIASNCLKFYPEVIGGYQSPVIVVLAICIFELFRKIKINCSDKVWEIDRLCFGVYLIHPVFIQFTYRFLHISPVSFKLYWLVFVVFFVVFVLCSFAASFLVNRIRTLRKYVL